DKKRRSGVRAGCRGHLSPCLLFFSSSLLLLFSSSAVLLPSAAAAAAGGLGAALTGGVAVALAGQLRLDFFHAAFDEGLKRDGRAVLPAHQLHLRPRRDQRGLRGGALVLA